MKSFIPTNENLQDKAKIIDFLDSLDTDANNKIEENDIKTEALENEEVQEETEKKIAEEPEKQECTALVTTKPNSLFVAQKMFKKSIKISIKSFLISLSLGFLNLFI